MTAAVPTVWLGLLQHLEATGERYRSFVPNVCGEHVDGAGTIRDITAATDIDHQAAYYEDALNLVMDNEYGNGTAIYTADGDTARDFASRVNVGMVGINFPIPVPLSYYSFGGWKKSAFGDLNQYGPDAFRFYTKTKTVTARWFSGIKDGVALNFKALD